MKVSIAVKNLVEKGKLVTPLHRKLSGLGGATGATNRDKPFRVTPAFIRLARDSQGGSLVETAVTVPIMIFLVTGMMSMGIMLNAYLSLTNAVQAAAMQVAISAGESGIDPCNLAATTAAAAAPVLSASNITYTFYFGGTSGTKAGPFKGTTASTCTSDLSLLTAGSNVTVEAQYPVSLTIMGWKPTTINLQSWSAELAQ
jgi:Flp pilus assembly protein TadG